MEFERVTVVGVNGLGAALAMALKAQDQPPRVIGAVDQADQLKSVRALDVFDRLVREPADACAEADLVILNRPLDALAEAMDEIAPHLPAGCVVTDTAPLKAPVMAWAADKLPEAIVFIGGHPIPHPDVGFRWPEAPEKATAELVASALYCLTPQPNVPEETLMLFLSLIEAIGAAPFVIDVTEHDGLMAGAAGVLDLLAVAVVRSSVDVPGWQELRKFLGHRFAAVSHPAADASERSSAVLLNREMIVQRMNVLLGELVRLRDLLATEDAERLEEAFAEAEAGRERWLAERAAGLWEKRRVSVGNIPSPGERLSQLLFGGLLGSSKQKE